MANTPKSSWTLIYNADGSSDTLLANVFVSPFSVTPRIVPSAVVDLGPYITASIDSLGNVRFTFDPVPDEGQHTLSGSFIF